MDDVSVILPQNEQNG